MSIWKKWQLSTIEECRASRRPLLLRFVSACPACQDLIWLGKPPAKCFSSFWANIFSLGDRERDFFVQCVELVCYGVGMHPTPAVNSAIERLAHGHLALKDHASHLCGTKPCAEVLCDVVLLPDGNPCTGWFPDKYDFEYYRTTVEVLEDRWNTSSGTLWALKSRNAKDEMNAKTMSNRQDNVLCESKEFPPERVNNFVVRYTRFLQSSGIATEESVSGIDHLSLSLLDEPMEGRANSLLHSLGDVFAAEKAKVGRAAVYPVICRIFSRLLAIQMRERNACPESAWTLGAELSSLPVGNHPVAQVSQKYVTDLLGMFDTTKFHCPASGDVAVMEGVLRNIGSCESCGVDRVLESFSQAVALCQLETTPAARDTAIAGILQTIPLIDRYLTSCEASFLRHDSLCDRYGQQEDCDSFLSTCPIGRCALDNVLCGAAREGRGKSADPRFPMPLQLRDCGGGGELGFWMPGVGLDSSFYATKLLDASDALSGMLGVPESIKHAQNEPQRIAHSLRHKVRMHALRRFAFINASKVWESSMSIRALPFLNALRRSLLTVPQITVLRFRDARQMPKKFDAVNEPSTVLKRFAPLNLAALASPPVFYGECGTVQDLEALQTDEQKKAVKSLRCCFSPNMVPGSSAVCELLLTDGLIASLVAVLTSQLQASCGSFVDIVTLTHDNRIVAHCSSPEQLLHKRRFCDTVEERSLSLTVSDE